MFNTIISQLLVWSLQIKNQTEKLGNTETIVGGLFEQILILIKSIVDYIINISVGIILKGDQANEDAIKALPTPIRGDTWKALDTGHYWAYDGTNWNDIGEIIPSDVALKTNSKNQPVAYGDTHSIIELQTIHSQYSNNAVLYAKTNIIINRPLVNGNIKVIEFYSNKEADISFYKLTKSSDFNFIRSGDIIIQHVKKGYNRLFVNIPTLTGEYLGFYTDGTTILSKKIYTGVEFTNVLVDRTSLNPAPVIIEDGQTLPFTISGGYFLLVTFSYENTGEIEAIKLNESIKSYITDINKYSSYTNPWQIRNVIDVRDYIGKSIKTLTCYSKINGVLPLYAYHKDSETNFRRIRCLDIVNVKKGYNCISVDITVGVDEYIGTYLSEAGLLMSMVSGQYGSSASYINSSTVLLPALVSQSYDLLDYPISWDFYEETILTSKTKESLKDAPSVLYNKPNIIDFSLTNWTYAGNLFTQNTVGFANKLILKKYYGANNKSASYQFTASSDSTVAFFCIPTTDFGENTATQGSLVSVDFINKKVAIHQKYDMGNTLTDEFISNDFITNPSSTSFTLLFQRVRKGINVMLIDASNSNIIASISTPQMDGQGDTSRIIGFMYDYFGIALVSGTSLTLNRLSVSLPNTNDIFLYIVGDSLTEGYPNYNDYAFAEMIKSNYPTQCVVSCRGGSKIDSVIERIKIEASLLKPKYIMVTIGTNGGNTITKLQQLVSEIENIGAIPIINHIPRNNSGTHTAINADIDTLSVDGAKLDLVPLNTANFVDGVHLTKVGNNLIYSRIKTDLPYLF